MTGPIDQLLFGYRDGHELIASSSRLTPTQLHDVLPHVDAAVQGEDERQLVGIWIASVERYLLARIWAAPERPRSGAVWTHALLLTPDQLGSGRLAGLGGMFRRPRDGATDGYAAPLPWPAAGRAPDVPARLGHALAVAAEARDDAPRIVLWLGQEQAEDALLALLDTLSGALRRRLSFRTRAHARPGPSPYRLLVAPSLIGTGGEPGTFVIDARERAAIDGRAGG